MAVKPTGNEEEGSGVDEHIFSCWSHHAGRSCRQTRSFERIGLIWQSMGTLSLAGANRTNPELKPEKCTRSVQPKTALGPLQLLLCVHPFRVSSMKPAATISFFASTLHHTSPSALLVWTLRGLDLTSPQH